MSQLLLDTHLVLWWLNGEEHRHPFDRLLSRYGDRVILV